MNIIKHLLTYISILIFLYLGFYLFQTGHKIYGVLSVLVGFCISGTAYYNIVVKPFKIHWKTLVHKVESIGFEAYIDKSNRSIIKTLISSSKIFNGDGVHLDKYWMNSRDVGVDLFGRYVMSSNMAQGTYYIFQQEKRLPKLTFRCSANRDDVSLEDSIDIVGDGGYGYLAQLPDKTRQLWSEINFVTISFTNLSVVVSYRMDKDSDFEKLYELIPLLVDVV